MNGWSALDRFRRTDLRDVEYAAAIELLHIYGELVAAAPSAVRRVQRAALSAPADLVTEAG